MESKKQGIKIKVCFRPLDDYTPNMFVELHGVCVRYSNPINSNDLEVKEWIANF